MQYPQRGEDVTISLLEEKRHPVAAYQGHAVSALGDRHIAFLWEDVLQVRLREVRRGDGAKRSRACVQRARFVLLRCAIFKPVRCLLGVLRAGSRQSIPRLPCMQA